MANILNCIQTEGVKWCKGKIRNIHKLICSTFLLFVFLYMNFFLAFRSYCERIFRDCRLQTCYVQSPAYPGVYPRHLNCRYYLNTRLPFIKLYIENEEFNIDGQRCENIMTCPMRPISSGTYIYHLIK